MTAITFTIIVAIASVLAGLLGALTGLGGGIIIVPLLVLGFSIDIHYAAGTALIAIIATSSGAAAAYVREGYTNIRLGMFLEIATTFGAMFGAYLSGILDASIISIIFEAFLLVNSFASIKNIAVDRTDIPKDQLATKLKLNNSYPSAQGQISYNVCNVPGGFLLMAIAGILSGLLGIGAGVMKVLAMDKLMKIPFKVSTTTSNFMIGVTAAASAGIYFRHGYVIPEITMPIMLGVLIGSVIGARLLPHIETSRLRQIFTILTFIIGVEMIYKGITKGL